MIESILKSNRVESTLSYMATMPLLTNISFFLLILLFKNRMDNYWNSWPFLGKDYLTEFYNVLYYNRIWILD